MNCAKLHKAAQKLLKKLLTKLLKNCSRNCSKLLKNCSQTAQKTAQACSNNCSVLVPKIRISGHPKLLPSIKGRATSGQVCVLLGTAAQQPCHVRSTPWSDGPDEQFFSARKVLRKPWVSVALWKVGITALAPCQGSDSNFMVS